MSPVVAGTRKKRGEGHTRRDEILSAAKTLFLREGYEATTTRRIADAVGVSAPALYLYFKDKEAIMVALCDQTFGFMLDKIAEIDKQGVPPVERLRHCGEAYIRFALEHPQEYWLTFMSGNMPKDMKKKHGRPIEELDPAEPGTMGAIAFARLVGVFRDIEASGTLLHYPAEAATEVVWMSLHGLVAAMINKADIPAAKRDTMIDNMLDFIARGVVKAA